MGKRVVISSENGVPTFLDDISYWHYWQGREDKLLVIDCVDKNHEKTQHEFHHKQAEEIFERLQKERIEGDIHNKPD